MGKEISEHLENYALGNDLDEELEILLGINEYETLDAELYEEPNFDDEEYKGMEKEDIVKDHFFDAITLLEEIETVLSDDFTIEIEGAEFRVINESEIEDAWTNSLIDMLEDCHGHEIPDHLKPYIDYDKWAQDAKIDGMGHHFSSYDGNEVSTQNFYIFRVN